MTLTSLIKELERSVQDGKVDPRSTQKLVDGRVILPDNFNIKKAKVEFKDLNVGDKPTTSLHHLSISSLTKHSVYDLQHVLYELVTRAKDLGLGKGVAGLEYGVFWSPEAFQNEKKLNGSFLDKIMLDSVVHTCDPTQVRIGMNGQDHKIKVTTERNSMILKATGNYSEHLGKLIEKFNFQYAKVNLSKDDAERFLKVAKKSPRGKSTARELEEALQPKPFFVPSRSLDGELICDIKEVVKLVMSIKLLQEYEDAIDKPLISQVTELTKIYGALGIIKGQRFSDLKELAQDIPKMDLGILYNYPVLTDIDAKKLLDAEINIISEGYKSGFKLDQDLYKLRGGIVKRLVMEHFGAKIFEGIGKAKVNQYVKTLKKLGYKPTQNFENDPAYIVKEKHLIEFFKQSYKKYPSESVKQFRDFYQNTEPEMKIFTQGVVRDASKLRRLKLPSQAKLHYFKIAERADKAIPYGNDLSIRETLPLGIGKMHFLLRTNVCSPILLPLQEYACKEMGISFR